MAERVRLQLNTPALKGNGSGTIGPGLPPAARAGEVQAPTRQQLQRALAYVDPSRLVAGWPQHPYNPGWLATRKGLQIVDQMLRDEQVKGALQFKKDSVLASGWELRSPADQPEDWVVTRFVRHCLEHLPGGFNVVLQSLLTALDYGYAVLEKVYGEYTEGEWAGRLGLRRLSHLKPHYIDFVTDEYGELLAVRQSGVAGAPQDLPPDKCLVYTYRARYGNYYGTSDLEACYRAWWVKDNAYKWLAVTLERYGMPPLFGLYDPNAYQPGQVEELKKIIRNIQNATLGVLPRPARDALELWSQQLGRDSTNLFFAALDRFDQHIARGLLVPSMIGVVADEGRSGSLARSATHESSFLRVVEQLQGDIATSVINTQLIPQLCNLNWSGLQSYPQFRFLPFRDEQRLEVLRVWSEMVNSKIVSRIEDDEVHIRKVLGFPENERVELPMEETPSAPAPAAPPPSVREVPPEEQTAEMIAFAEATGGQWYEVFHPDDTQPQWICYG